MIPTDQNPDPHLNSLPVLQRDDRALLESEWTVKVIMQTQKRLYTLVESSNRFRWWVMTDRLTKLPDATP